MKAQAAPTTLGDRIRCLPHLRLRPLHQCDGEDDLSRTGVTLRRPDGDNGDTNDEARSEDDPSGAAEHGAEQRRSRRPAGDVLAEGRVTCTQRVSQSEDAKLLRRPSIGCETEQLIREPPLFNQSTATFAFSRAGGTGSVTTTCRIVSSAVAALNGARPASNS